MGPQGAEEGGGEHSGSGGRESGGRESGGGREEEKNFWAGRGERDRYEGHVREHHLFSSSHLNFKMPMLCVLPVLDLEHYLIRRAETTTTTTSTVHLHHGSNSQRQYNRQQHQRRQHLVNIYPPCRISMQLPTTISSFFFDLLIACDEQHQLSIREFPHPKGLRNACNECIRYSESTDDTLPSFGAPEPQVESDDGEAIKLDDSDEEMRDGDGGEEEEGEEDEEEDDVR